MANKTIPQLPEQTGKTDNDLLAIVDSGETVTSKIKVSTLLSGVGGGQFVDDGSTNSIIPDYYTSGAIGTNVTNAGIFQGTSNVIPNGSTNANTVVVGGSNNSCSAGSNNGIFAGTTSTVGNNGGPDVIVGSLQTSIGGPNYYRGVYSSRSTTNNGGWYSSILGGQSHSITSGFHSVIVGGLSNSIGNFDKTVILGGSSQSALQDNEVVVPNIRITNYASLNFSGDTAAAAGGVQLGQLYHDNGQARIRIT